LKKRIVAIVVIIILLFLSITPVYAIETSFNLKNYINIPVKDQMGTGSCWILAMGTVLETNLALKNGINYEMSARHMDYTTSQSFKNDVINPMGFARQADSGGTADIALAYLTNGSGPVAESEMPFSTVFGDIDISEIQGKNIQYQVKKWVKFPSIVKEEVGTYYDDENNQYTISQVNNIREQIKKHIKENGAVYAGVYAETGFTDFYNPETFAYNCNDYYKKTDHAVVIIGWDDNFSKDNFKDDCKPKSNGAYIVQNSWGNDSRLNNGTYYVSYEDTVIETSIYGIVDVQEKNYYKLYQYDELGCNQYFDVSGIDEAFGINIFDRENIQNEVVTQIGITTYMPVDCEIYLNQKNGSLEENNLIKVKEARVNAGYSTIDLGSKYLLKGNKFAVVVKYKRVGDILGITTISRYSNKQGGNPYIYKKSEQGQSYLGASLNNLRDLHNSDYTSVCIKAFTKIVDNVELEDEILGDINGDGKVTAIDLAQLQSHIVGLRVLEDVNRADLNKDGKITAIDLSKLFDILVHLVVTR